MENRKEQTAIVTGASSGIGEAICSMLVQNGYEVFGFGRDFSQINESLRKAERFHTIVCDLLCTEQLTREMKQIRTAHAVQVLVNCAGVAYYGLHEELNPAKIQKMVRTNLEVPMILCNLLLRDLKMERGTIVDVSSVTAVSVNPHGCAYGATKAGLSNFSRSLFEEARKYGVRVINIQPDMTDTNLYRNADFGVDTDVHAYISAQEVAETVAFALFQREGISITDMTIRPQLHRIKRNEKRN